MSSSFYDHFFGRIPDELIRGISNGCTFGDKAYEQIRKSEPRLFDSLYLYGLQSKLHDKAIQFYLDNKLGGSDLIQTTCKNVGFGNRVLYISGRDFLMIPCHVSRLNTLPCPSKYKLKASKYNPGRDLDQLNLWAPPISKNFENVYFVLANYFDSLNTISQILLPDSDFVGILDHKSVLSSVPSEEETAYQERIMPKLISEVEKEHEQGNG